MHKVFAVLAIAIVGLTGCSKKSSTPSAKSGDPVQQKVEQLAGSGATDCGRLKSMDHGEMKTASDCAMQASQKKQPFYVTYDMPGLTIAIAGTSEGRIYMVQSQQAANAQLGAAPEAKAEPCPAELRVAQSGRVTCYAAGSFGMDSMGASPHGGMMMPPATGENPHGGMMSMPPSGTPNPHAAPTKPQTTTPSKTKQ